MNNIILNYLIKSFIKIFNSDFDILFIWHYFKSFEEVIF